MEKTYSLAVNQSDLRFFYKNKFLRTISISSNKTIELRKNKLLEPEKLKQYNELCIVHDKKLLKLPIVQDSPTYNGRNGELLQVTIPDNVQLSKEDLEKWHLKLFKPKRTRR